MVRISSRAHRRVDAQPQTPSTGSIAGQRAESIGNLRKDVTALRENFKELVGEQTTLGFTESSGLRRDLRDASNAVERIINENMTWLAEKEATKLMMSLLTMRHHEAQYRLAPTELTRQQFLSAYKHFTDIFAQIDGTPEMKVSLEGQVKTYADTFEKWIEAYDRVHPLRAIIDIDSQRMRPQADEIIDRARRDRRSSGGRTDGVASDIPAPGLSLSASPWSRLASASAG